MIRLSKLYYLKNQIEQATLQYDALTTLQQLALEDPRTKIEEMQSWLRVMIKKYLETITLRPKKTNLRRIKDVCDLKDLAFTLDLEKG